MNKAWPAIALASLCAWPAAARADIDSVYVGLTDCAAKCSSANKGDGPSLGFQASFDSPDYLSWAGAPQPYLIWSENLADGTSFGGVGLEWSRSWDDGWSIVGGVGYVIHDGELDNPYVSGTPEADAHSRRYVFFGSRDLFRLSLGVSRDLPGPWAAQVLVEHLSHGQILGSGRNQGLDQVSLRVQYEFGE